MPSVSVVEGEAVPWLTPKEGQSGEKVPTSDPDIKGASRYLHPGIDTQLYLHLSHTPPNMEVHSHVHREDEIIYVTEGELHLGARVLRAGDSVHIPGNTLYAFRSGPEGLTFLNFRGRRDESHILKEDFMAERAAAKLANAESV